MTDADEQPTDDETGKTVIRRRAVPAKESLDQTQGHRPPPAGPEVPGEPASPPRPPKRRGGLARLRPDQVRYLIVAWLGLSLIVGVCAFAGIFWASGQIRSTDATPIGQVAINTAVPTTPPQTVIPTLIPTEQAAPAAPTDTGGSQELPPIEAFNLGGQSIHGGFPGQESMKQAGMTWVKLQADSLDVDFGPAIENAHNLGFRILISVVDKPNKDRVTAPDYQQTYADYMVNLAKQGADALEVWNEENIDREWPAGEISGAAYTDLLKFVYSQIKAANPNTMVISGALSPTGFFAGGCTAAGCDDRPFLRDMVNAGVLNYADCVGIHYNEGIVSPTQTSGDTRGNPNHYTRYYQTMVSTYDEVTGGLKPLCFTELGYLTGEGYPDLTTTAPRFAWAAKTTVAEQAQWLAEAVTLAKASDGQVHLLVVFNVDYTEYGADPQAGYAIVRPDGSCPACETLGAVMKE